MSRKRRVGNALVHHATGYFGHGSSMLPHICKVCERPDSVARHLVERRGQPDMPVCDECIPKVESELRAAAAAPA